MVFFGIGCMSGSSLDGMDLCYVGFTEDTETASWKYDILRATTIPYNNEWRQKLQDANSLNGENLIRLHMEYGHYIGQTIAEFIQTEDIVNLDFVASHGHTIFHQPNQGYTFQLGDGETTAVHLNHPFVCNFRNKDVALGGQGAPLVPNGERYLFCDNDICINLGGIANIGIKGSQGYDVCPCNYVSNKLAKIYNVHLEYDQNGELAEKGTINHDILEQLDSLPFYKLSPPKSLGAEWIEAEVMPILNVVKYSIPDLLSTYVEHITNRLVESCMCARDALNQNSVREDTEAINKKVLVTGGGAYNTFLMKVLEIKLNANGIYLQKTDDRTIAFKEALIFAFLGLKCILNQENVLRTVTGSSQDSISGSIHRPARAAIKPQSIIRSLIDKK